MGKRNKNPKLIIADPKGGKDITIEFYKNKVCKHCVYFAPAIGDHEQAWCSHSQIKDFTHPDESCKWFRKR